MKLERIGEFRVLTLRETPVFEPTADTPEIMADYYRAHVKTDPRYNPDIEQMNGIIVSTRRKILGHYLVAQGTLDTILCHPRELFRPAVIANAAALVMIHNHPSGDPTPSEADIKCTRDMIRAGQCLKIELLDHLIMGEPTAVRADFVSLRTLGYFYS